jgi:hypothetical protein
VSPTGATRDVSQVFDFTGAARGTAVALSSRRRTKGVGGIMYKRVPRVFLMRRTEREIAWRRRAFAAWVGR